MNNIVGEWVIRYKNKTSGNWKELTGKNGYWYADPILLDYKNKTYLFMEAFCEITYKGKLAVSVYDEVNEVFDVPKIIMDRPYHLSYPEVFIADGKVYMIPETSQNRTLELYIAEDDSLLKWKREAVLINKCYLADTTVVKYEDKLFLYTYEEKKSNYTTLVYELNICDKVVKLLAKNTSEINDKRPAGNFFVNSNNEFLRPLQFNINIYGEKISFEKIRPGEAVGYKVTGEMDISSLVAMNAIKIEEKFYKVHTFNENERFFVVDMLRDKIDPLAFIKKYIRKGRNFIFKMVKGR